MPNPGPSVGLHPDMDRNEYEDVFALNQSSIKTAYDRSLMHARYQLNHPSEPSEALVEGNALHTLILEPSKFNDEYAPMPVDANGSKLARRTKAGAKAWAEYEDEHGDKIPMKQKRIEELMGTREAVLKHPVARQMVENAKHVEVPFFWEHPEYGFDCKGQFDLLTTYKDWTWCVDLKSAVDASKAGFARAVSNFGYMIQEHWYLEGLHAIAPARRRFAFIVFEKDPPHAVGVYTLDDRNRFEGAYRCNAISAKWAGALETDRFSGYSPVIEQVGAKPWAMTHEREVIPSE